MLDALVELRESPVLVVAGNHDHAEDVEGFSRLPWVTVATVPTVVDLGGARVFAMPFAWRGWLYGTLEQAPGLEEGQDTLEARLRHLLRAWSVRMAEDRERGIIPIFAGHFLVAGGRASGGEVLGPGEVSVSPQDLDALGAAYCGLGHLHQVQKVADRAWYPGSLWFTDHGERNDRKGWLLVDIGNEPHAPIPPNLGDCEALVDLPDLGVVAVPSNPRPVATLDWRWAAEPVGEDQAARTYAGEVSLFDLTALQSAFPTWTERPTDEEIEACRGAEVRCRISVPQPWVASMPWAEELARVEAVAHRIVVERSIEPVLRARAPEVAAAVTVEGKLAAYWSTLATPPTEGEQAAALEALAALRGQPDDEALATQIRGGGA